MVGNLTDLTRFDNGQDNLRTIEPGDGSEDQLAYADPDNDGFTNTQEQVELDLWSVISQ